MKDFILVLAGPSGVGKTTVADALTLREPRFRMTRSHTTRARRGDGRDDEYIYVTREEFLKLVSLGEMLEYTEYSGTLYGTSKAEIFSILSEGNIPLLVLDYNGVRSLKSQSLGSPVISVYIYASLGTAKERLVKRAGISAGSADTSALTDKRHSVNVADYLDIKSRVGSFDFMVENASLDTAVDTVLSLLESPRPFELQSEDYKSRIADKLYQDALNFK